MKINYIIASIFGLLAVILGAFGAHALKESLDIESLKSFETGVRYMMYHAIIVLFVNNISSFSKKKKNIISNLFFTGIIFFSGSIFAITVGNIDAKNIWFITPLGGLLLISGWIMMILSFAKNNSQKN